MSSGMKTVAFAMHGPYLHLPNQSLDVDRKHMEVSFQRDKCIACEGAFLCCPYHAMEILL
jgi:formate hydrogenlyase subunit 6/NADH:ubiquinone oxidoreductase subunit I